MKSMTQNEINFLNKIYSEADENYNTVYNRLNHMINNSIQTNEVLFNETLKKDAMWMVINYPNSDIIIRLRNLIKSGIRLTINSRSTNVNGLTDTFLDNYDILKNDNDVVNFINEINT